MLLIQIVEQQILASLIPICRTRYLTTSRDEIDDKEEQEVV